MATEAKSVKRPPPHASASSVVAAAAAARGSESKGNLIHKSQSQSRPPISNEKRKIEISATKRPIDPKMKSTVGTAISKAEVKLKSEPGTSKAIATTSKTTTTTTTSKTTVTKTKVKEKKVYTLPGQKHDPPEEREPLMIFYESLSKQIPSSEMAEFWMMEHGLLSPERAKKAFEKKQRKQKQIRLGIPLKPLPPPTKPESSQRQNQASKNGDIKAKKKVAMDSDNCDIKAKKKVAMDSDDDDDFIMSPKRRKT